MNDAAVSPRVGVLFGSGGIDPIAIAETAAKMEDLGVSELWASEDYFYTGGIAAATIALTATQTIAVGTGVLPIYTRHPSLAAMEAATLARAFPGRFRLGVGTGVPKWLDQMGIGHHRPLEPTAEYIEALRALGAGNQLSTGQFRHFHTDSIRLHDSAPFPVYLGAIGPNMLRLGAERADGVILSVLASPDYVRWARQLLQQRGSGGEGKPLVTFAMFACHEDGAVARAQARRRLSARLRRVTRMTDFLGLSDEIQSRADMTDEEFEAWMPDEWRQMLTVSGDPAECAASIRRLTDSGSSSVTLHACDPQTVLSQVAALLTEINVTHR